MGGRGRREGKEGREEGGRREEVREGGRELFLHLCLGIG